MILALSIGFLAAIAGIFALSGGSLAATGAIVLMWLSAGLAIGLLMAWGGPKPPIKGDPP